MGRDPEQLFQEEWELSARRINSGKYNKDRIRFYLTDGTTKTFEIPLMQSEQMKDEFLEITLKALNSYPIEALLLTYEAWFVDDEMSIEDNVDDYLKAHHRPIDHPQRREGVNFYYETISGVMLTALAEIVTNDKKKRGLAKLPAITKTAAVGRMSHFFRMAREYAVKPMMLKNIIDGIIQEN